MPGNNSVSHRLSIEILINSDAFFIVLHKYFSSKFGYSLPNFSFQKQSPIQIAHLSSLSNALMKNDDSSLTLLLPGTLKSLHTVWK